MASIGTPMDTATKEADSLPQRPHRTQGHCVLCVFGGSRYLIAEAGEGNRRLGGRIGRDRSRRNTPLLIGKRPHAELEGHAPCRTGRTCSMQNGKDTLHAEREGHAPCRTGRTRSMQNGKDMLLRVRTPPRRIGPETSNGPPHGRDAIHCVRIPRDRNALRPSRTTAPRETPNAKYPRRPRRVASERDGPRWPGTRCTRAIPPTSFRNEIPQSF